MEPGDSPLDNLLKAILTLDNSDDEFKGALDDRIDVCLRKSQFWYCRGNAHLSGTKKLTDVIS